MSTHDSIELHYCSENLLVMLIEVETYKLPRATGTTQEGNTRVTHYEKGRIAGDALVFRLDSGKYLGGYSFDVKSSELTGSSSFDEFKAELLKSYEAAVYDGARKFAIPGAIALVPSK